jgi:threonine aldolase
LWNAVVATGLPAKTWANLFDSVSVCFSKGLGAPVGSALAGSRDFIAKARRIRKLLGGGMRQAGVLAAAALYALDHHVNRMAEDHRHARVLAQAVADTPGLRLKAPEVDTNIVIFQIDRDLGTAQSVADALQKRGVLMMAFAPQAIRACTHLDVSSAQAERAADVLRKVVPQLTPVA